MSKAAIEPCAIESTLIFYIDFLGLRVAISVANCANFLGILVDTSPLFGILTHAGVESGSRSGGAIGELNHISRDRNVTDRTSLSRIHQFNSSSDKC